MSDELLFALDIGTRSVIGLVGEIKENKIRILATERQEHHTRAMLDGQIHDVIEVAAVLKEVKEKLEQTTGPLKQVSVAAAGRALCTVKAVAEIEAFPRGVLSREDEISLELTAIQEAQKKLASQATALDPTNYYCVGFSVMNYDLDGTHLTSLIGQRGKLAKVSIIATFLPRQVIDSLQSAIQAVDLTMATLTLEPIAALNVLIPPTMRHLNLVLVDIGAGTSDVAITKSGTVAGYGMVPCAGDEITEAISQNYLLDFNVAEAVKRQLADPNREVEFSDVLGLPQKIKAQDIIEQITPTVAELAQAIAKEILNLNSQAPQAVLLVGGGSLTPLLPQMLAQALDLPAARVAIRRPDMIEGIQDVPTVLHTPDAITPLGILKVSGSNNLNFINITFNEAPLRLFNLGNLTVADALLAAGVDIRKMQGRPGMGLTVSVNGETRFIPGTMGKSGMMLLNGQVATFKDTLEDGAVLIVKEGIGGKVPEPKLREMIPAAPALKVIINCQSVTIAPIYTVNGQVASPDQILKDRDQIVSRETHTLAEVLNQVDSLIVPKEYEYTVNESPRTYFVKPQYVMNGHAANLEDPVKAGDDILALPAPEPTLSMILGLDEEKPEVITVKFNGAPCPVVARTYELKLNGNPAKPTDFAPHESHITYTCVEKKLIVSDVLLAANYSPGLIPGAKRVEVLLNGKSTEYTALIKSGDHVEVKIIFED